MRNWISIGLAFLPVLLTAQVNINVNFVQSNISCFGECDGAATAVGIGGTLPYTYVWEDGSTGPSRANLCAGTYSVTATDANQNTGTGTVTIVQPNQLSVEVSTENQICGVAPDGIATAIPTGGTAPYTYLWSNGMTGEKITGLEEGTYSVTVTDFNGCTAAGSAEVFFWNEGIWLMITNTDILCYGDSNGTIHVGPMSGTPPYTYDWGAGFPNSQDLMDLAPGTYTVTVTDVNGCFNTASATVIEPLPLTSGADSLPAACGQPGSATVTPSGGTPGYMVMWSNGDTTVTTNAPAGPLSVTVTDANGCTFDLDLNIPGNNTDLAINTTPLSEAGCLIGGSASAAAFGGSGDYNYLWSNGDSTAVVTDLAIGTYTVTITDMPTGCTGTSTVQIVPVMPDLSVEGEVVANATCLTGGTGTAVASGGTPPYIYIWDGVDTTVTSSNLSAGIHIVTAIDSTGCVASDTINIQAPVPPNVTADIENPVTCNTGGSAIATASAGLPPYVFAWSNGDSTATASNLQAGTYMVTVTDANGCTAKTSVTLTTPELPTVQILAVVQASCTMPGSASAEASGGTPPYTYFWDNGDTTATSANLMAGTHTVTVTDAGGCTGTATAIVEQPEPPVATAQMDQTANCSGGGGSASASAVDGTPPYLFVWNTGDSTTTLTDISAGTYTVTVTDNESCTATATVTVQESDPPLLSSMVTAAATCAAPGSAETTATSGTPPYTYLWSNSATTATITGLTPGTYSVTVTDMAGCTAADAVQVNDPPQPMVAISDTTNANCAGPGSATAAATGGTPPYNYFWDNGETTATAVNLAPGTHTVTLTDGGGCIDSASVLIESGSSGGIQLGDFVWLDEDQDGFQHPLEDGVADISVMLIVAGPDSTFGTPDDLVIDSTQTDSTGHYLFECVQPDTYVIMFGNLPAGYEFTKKDKVNNDCKDSDAKSNGKTDPFVIAPNQSNNLCVDAGIHLICINVISAGIICCEQTICEGETPEALYEAVPPVGGAGNLEYLWMQLVQMGPAPPTWMAIPGATNIDYQPGPLFETSYFMRCVRREDCANFLETNIIKITVIPAGTNGCPQFITNFNVQAISMATVQVDWRTMPELTKYLYRVERSKDQQNWTLVEEVPGHEDANAPNVYRVMDHAPSNGMNYYRIKRLSANGAELISDIRNVELTMEVEESMAIYPNPVTQVLYIRNLMTYDNDASIQLFTTSGKLLYTLKIPAGTFQHFDVPVADLPQGLYLARIRFGNGKTNTVKVSKF